MIDSHINRAASYQANACWSSNNRDIGYVGAGWHRRLEEIKGLQLVEIRLGESMLRNHSMATTSMARHPAAVEIGDTLSCLAVGPNALRGESKHGVWIFFLDLAVTMHASGVWQVIQVLKASVIE